MCEALGHDISDLSDPLDQPWSWSFFVSRNLQCQKEACPIVRGISMTAANVYKPSISGSFADEWPSKRAIESVNPVKGVRKWEYEHRY